MNVVGIIVSLIIIVRYLSVDSALEERHAPGAQLNLGSLIIGLAAATGLLMVAAFQDVNVLPVHMIGGTVAPFAAIRRGRHGGGTLMARCKCAPLPHTAVLLFTGGAIYELLQTILSRRVAPRQRRLWQLRMGITLFMYLCGILCVVLGVVALALASGKRTGGGTAIWPPTMPGYVEHVIRSAGLSGWRAIAPRRARRLIGPSYLAQRIRGVVHGYIAAALSHDVLQ